MAACGFYTEGARWVFCSVDRVFRNETMDATHLCEFHQVEGVVLDERAAHDIRVLLDRNDVFVEDDGRAAGAEVAHVVAQDERTHSPVEYKC